MATIRPSVVKWTPVVDSELANANVPLPRDLILAMIDVESDGVAGLTNPKSGASGLMQVMPGTLKWYNNTHQSQVSLGELRSSSLAAAVKQIRVGIAVIAAYWRSAWKYLSDKFSSVPIDNLAHIADLFYVAGPGATKERLDMMTVPPTWNAIQTRFPKWNALPHPRNVFSYLDGIVWPTAQIFQWLESKKPIFEPTPKEGFLISMLAIMAAWWMMKTKG
jgi:hypothetical protein